MEGYSSVVEQRAVSIDVFEAANVQPQSSNIVMSDFIMSPFNVDDFDRMTGNGSREGISGSAGASLIAGLIMGTDVRSQNEDDCAAQSTLLSQQPESTFSSSGDDQSWPATLSQIRPSPSSAFADYAITTPGLSVVRAKVDIFNSIVGPEFTLDIGDPRAVSPLCLGVNTKPCPTNFLPTYLQRSIPHHPILDVLPWPSFRDRFLYTMSLPEELRPGIAQDDMPNATLQLMMAIKDAGGGIRVWGSNAYLEDNWEIGQTFYSKFWWALDAGIVRSSNKHRARRGETQLRFEESFT